VSSLGIAANAALGIERDTVASADPPAGRVRLGGETVTLSPSCGDSFAATERSYVAGDAPVFVNVTVFDALYGPEPGT